MIRNSVSIRRTVQFEQKRFIWNRIREIFVQAPNLTPSQSEMNALGFRRESPASKSIKEMPVIPRTAPGGQFKTRYYDRKDPQSCFLCLRKAIGDTMNPTKWTYKDSEGKEAAVGPCLVIDFHMIDR
eukprot:765122-Hanusia_phi.AAC.2